MASRHDFAFDTYASIFSGVCAFNRGSLYEAALKRGSTVLNVFKLNI